jgi:hypothetical protein
MMPANNDYIDRPIPYNLTGSGRFNLLEQG